MSKEPSDALFLLIRRMSKSEKRHFKLMAARNKTGEGKFIRLFDRLEKMKTYDEKKLLRLEPAISARQLPNQKMFLYDYLLRSLRLCNSSASADLDMAELIGNARVLYDKCLYTDCVRLIDKGKKLAQKNGRSVQMIELLELERLAIRHTIKARHTSRVEETVENAQEVLSHVNMVNRFEDLSLRLNTFYIQLGFIRSRQDYERVAAFFRKNLPEYQQNELSPVEKLYLYDALTGYFFYVQDFRNGYKYAQRGVGLFETHPELIRNKTEMYIRALNSLLVALNKQGNLEAFEKIHRQLVSLKRSHGKKMTENLNLNLFKAIYIHEINRHFMRGEFRAGVRIVGKLEDELNRFIPFLDHHSILLFYYKIACLYFGADQYKRALFWLNRIINEKDIAVREDIHAFSRILALICHYELGNDRLAESHIKSLYRFLLKKGDLSAYNKLILNFLRKMHRNLLPNQWRKLFLELKSKMEILARQRFEKRAFYYFDIISWLESKIERRTVEQIVKEKMRRKTGVKIT